MMATLSDSLRFMKAVDDVLKWEGGLADNPNDHGAITNYGISLRYLESLNHIEPGTGYMAGDLDHDGDIDPDDIRMMTRAEAIAIYHAQWWERYGYGRIRDDALMLKTFNLAVNMGPGRAHRLLQEAIRQSCEKPACKVKVDGVLGPVSFGCLNSCVPRIACLENFKKNAVRFYTGLNQPKFLKGWTRRAMA